MATTRINSIHQHKGKDSYQTLEKCIGYINDCDKTGNIENLVSTFDCDVYSTAIEFLIPKKIYEEIVGRTQKNNILAYHIRQSFKPGEISPELANEIGYSLAKEVTKGEHQFIVATHTDKAHIHNHIIFNSTSFDGKRKYNEAYSWRKIYKISDRLCLENNLSVVDNTLGDGEFFYKSNAYNKHMGGKKEQSFSDMLRNDIKKSLLECPKDFEDFLNKMRDKGYEIKINKNIAFKGNGQKRFKRLSSLGEQYAEEIIREAIKLNNETKLKREAEQRKKISQPKSDDNVKEPLKQEVKKVSITEQLNLNKAPYMQSAKQETKKISITEQLNKSGTQKRQVANREKINSFIELKDIAESKGAGYEVWASKYNLNELVKTFNYLSQNNLLNYEKLEEKMEKASKEFNKSNRDIKEISAKMEKISILQGHIVNFSKTKEIYLEYRGTGYNQKFKNKHEAEISIHQEAKNYFKSLGYSKLPKMDELKREYATLSVEKKKLYKVYNEAKFEKEKFDNIKPNIDSIYSDKLKSQKKSITEQLR